MSSIYVKVKTDLKHNLGKNYCKTTHFLPKPFG